MRRTRSRRSSSSSKRNSNSAVILLLVLGVTVVDFFVIYRLIDVRALLDILFLYGYKEDLEQLLMVLGGNILILLLVLLRYSK